LTGCAPSPQRPDADVVVIGAGIAGIAAALEASENGASVTLVEMNSIGGGHAVMAGGLFLVGTPLQAEKGVQDSVELAVADMLAWGEDPDPSWVQRYARDSRKEVHDWLTGLGVEFRLLLPAPGETSVPRFHFTRGTAINVVVPMMRESLDRSAVSWRLNTEATGISRGEDGTWTVSLRQTRTGNPDQLRARTVIVTTGGFEGDLERVRRNWPADIRAPQRLLNGAGYHARGSGLDLATQAGAATRRLDNQTIFVTGFPNPRDKSGMDGLLAMNSAAIFVDGSGQRFIDESASRKDLEKTVLAMPGQSYWMIFDNQGKRRLQVRGAPWLNRETLDVEILDNSAIVQQADDLASLAMEAGLPASEFELTVAAYNAKIVLGEPDPFGRFSDALDERKPPPLGEPPFYALRLYPMSRKSLGGLAIDSNTRVLDDAGMPVPGLHAAGEATGVAGINGSYGGSGTFLGPSVYTGRIAGRAAAQASAALARPDPGQATATPGADTVAPTATAGGPMLNAPDLEGLLASSRPGYWHFEQAHALVRERGWDCTDCHSSDWPTGPAWTIQQKRAQLESCARCH
jgi:predicted oxidoreductase